MLTDKSSASQSQIFARRLRLLLGLAVFVGLILLVSQPVEQPLDYHRFADQRSALGITNAADVLSNLPFVVVGILGFFWMRLKPELAFSVRAGYATFFAGLILTGIGSGYYHLAPDNQTLIWDRLAMTVCFAGLLALVIAERVDQRMAAVALPCLLITGVVTVAYWGWVDDLRPYLLLQFGAMLLLPVIILRTRGTGTRWLWLALLCYLIAKVTEMTDEHLFHLTEQLISGHSLKHVAAAMSGLMIALKLRYS